MKKLVIASGLLALSACGAIGIGSNHRTMVYNNSNDLITVTSDSGSYKVEPNMNVNVYSKEQIAIQNKNANCSQINIQSELNSGALILDIIPGLALGIIPILVDAISGDLYRMPKSYSYDCAG